MKNTKVTLAPLTADDREQFILDNQWAFKYGAMLEFGERDDRIDDDGEIISRETIERCIDDLGRVVIPKEIRRTMRIREGDPSLTGVHI